MVLARRGRVCGAIGVIVDRAVPQIIVRTGRAAHSVASIDRTSGPMRERAWPVLAKAELAEGVERRGTAGGMHRENNAGYAHFPQLVFLMPRQPQIARHLPPGLSALWRALLVAEVRSYTRAPRCCFSDNPSACASR